ncbi:MAG: PA0069 family radical SAM protein [Alphaproteobacteria bacterium]|mgnify:CR=1 FL=1|nr:PA0069 family radical SAM protein [Alphaproteobacteria bacterium]
MASDPRWRSRSASADWSEAQTRARGRGARSNASGRFEKQHVEPVDDGWDGDPEAPPALRTEAIVERSKTIITYNTSPDISFDRTVNPYKGCEHGCIYCYARPNHTYRGLSAGLDFETKIFIKPGAADLLERELARKTYRVAPIMLGGDTDIYQPYERSLQITRSILGVLNRYDHPVNLITKSALILRDIDILAPMAARGLCGVAISLTSLDRGLSRRMEPRAATPDRRLEAMRQLALAGVPVIAMTAPLIPALNEPELERLLEAASQAGATRAGYVLLRLPLEIAGLFTEWLEASYPDRARRVMNLLRSMHGGEEYRSDWGVRQRGEGPYAQLIADRFRAAARRFGLNRVSFALRTDLFRRPARGPAGSARQLSLFAADEP